MVRTRNWRTPGKRFILGIILTLLYITSIASPQLVLTTDKIQTKLGQPVRVKLYGVSIKARLSDIDLKSLTPDFGVIADYTSGVTQDQRWPGQPVQMMQFKLYPRKAGKIVIPSLRLGKIHSQEQVLTISAGETGIPILQFDTDSPYQRQEMIIHFTLTTRSSNARLTSKDSFKLKGFEIVPLDFFRTPVAGGKYRLQAGWALTPLTAGKHQLQLPPVEYSISGGSRKLFYPPLRTISVKSLPSYLPPTIPVGEISVISHVAPAGLLHTDALSYWTLQLTAKATDVYSLPPVLRQVKSNSGLQVFPVTTSRKIQVHRDNVTSQVTHTIPFKSLTSGRLTLPEIQFRYFDPGHGTIKLISYTTEPVFVLSYFWEAILAVISIILFIWLAKVAITKRQHWRRLNKKRQMAIQLLQKPESKNSIRKAIRLFCEADTGAKNTTLLQWKKYWLKLYKTDENFENLYNAVSHTCYSGQDNINLNAIGSELTNLFKNRKRNKIFRFGTIEQQRFQ